MYLMILRKSQVWEKFGSSEISDLNQSDSRILSSTISQGEIDWYLRFAWR